MRSKPMILVTGPARSEPVVSVRGLVMRYGS
jgi:hypothetical protein